MDDVRDFSTDPNLENILGGGTRPYDAIEQSVPEGIIGKKLSYREG